MRWPKHEDKKDPTDEQWAEHIIEELPDDPDYDKPDRPCRTKSAAVRAVKLWYHRLRLYEEIWLSHKKEITRMERRNLKLQQKITRLSKALKLLKEKTQ